MELSKVLLFLDRSCGILTFFKIVVIFNNTSAEIKTKSADLLLKMTTILKELRIAQLWFENKGALPKQILSVGRFEKEGASHFVGISQVLKVPCLICVKYQSTDEYSAPRSIINDLIMFYIKTM